MLENRQREGATVSRLLRESASFLQGRSESARLDAELLLAHVLGRSRVQLYGSGTDPVRPELVIRFIDLVHERGEGRPVAQILGSREFWSMKLTVTADTLIPRPETELLVECALTHVPRRARSHVLDLGTGSGAVTIALARERSNAMVTGTDLSEAALAVARYNAASYDLDNAGFAFGDWYGAVRDELFDVIVSNPPYITDQEWMLYNSDLHYEPTMALRGGRDGLLAIRPIVEQAHAHLVPGGWLLIEHGFRQGPNVANLFQTCGFERISTYRDLPGHPRVTEGRWPGPQPAN